MSRHIYQAIFEMLPKSSVLISHADGLLGKPGMAISSPVRATTNPAPADNLNSLTSIEKFSGAFSKEGSSLKEYWVLETQMGNVLYPCDFSHESCFWAFGR